MGENKNDIINFCVDEIMNIIEKYGATSQRELVKIFVLHAFNAGRLHEACIDLKEQLDELNRGEK